MSELCVDLITIFLTIFPIESRFTVAGSIPVVTSERVLLDTGALPQAETAELKASTRHLATIA